jgi:hypothetical protein
MCHLLPSGGRCNCYPRPQWQMRYIILQRAQIRRLVSLVNRNLVPHPWQHYLRLVPYYHRNTHFVRTHG